METYSHLRRRRGRTRHVPQIPAGVLCLGGDSYPRGAVIGAVINVDGVAAGILSAPVDIYVLADRKDFSAVRPQERDVRPALHSEVGVALVCDRQVALQQDLHSALSGRIVIDRPRVTSVERGNVLRDPEPGSSTGATVLDYQAVAGLQVGALPLDLTDAPHQPDFSAVGLGDVQR